MAINNGAINSFTINGSSLNGGDQNLTVEIQYSNLFSGNVENSITSFYIHKGGYGFQPSDIYEIAPNNGKFLIKQCSQSSVVSLEYIDFGYGFDNTFQQILYPNKTKNYAKASVGITNGQITSVSIIDGGSGYTVAPTISVVGGNGVGAKLTCTISGGSVDSISIVYPGNLYTHAPSIIFDSDVCVIEHRVGILRKYPGHYKQSNSLISDDSFIQDGDYYQIYSYELEVDELFDTYKNVVKKLLHPAGYNIFGTLSKFDVKSIAAAAKVLLMETDQFPIDEVFVGDIISKFLSKILEDSASVTDSTMVSFIKSLSDSLSVEDVIDLLRVMALADTTNITDYIEKNVTKTFSDSTNSITDSVLIPTGLKLIISDNILAHAYNANKAYGTNLNMDYFAENYLEIPENFSKSL